MTTNALISCPSGKRIYWTKADARQAKHHIRIKFQSKQRYYVCPHCGYYHLTRSKTNLREQLTLELFKRLIADKLVRPFREYPNGLSLYRINYKQIWYFVGYDGNGSVRVLYSEKIEVDKQ